MKLCAHEEDKLLDILDKGAQHAQKEAEITLKHMKQHAGILRRSF